MNRVSNRDASSRNSQNRQRNRGRNNNSNNRRGPNPLQRSYESNGPDVKIRGNAMQVAEKYLTLARDAQVAGDRILAENYMQHAEHYSRIIAAAQAASQQNQQQAAQQAQDNQQQSSGNEQVNGAGPQPGLDGAAENSSKAKPQRAEAASSGPSSGPSSGEESGSGAAEQAAAGAAEEKPSAPRRGRRPKVVSGEKNDEEAAEKSARKPRARRPKANEELELVPQPDAAE